MSPETVLYEQNKLIYEIIKSADPAKDVSLIQKEKRLIIKRLGEGIVKWTGFSLSRSFFLGPLFRLF